MRGFKGLTITPGMVIDANIFDEPPANYNAATTYALGAYVSVPDVAGKVKVYSSLQAPNLNHTPASSPTWWKHESDTYEAYVNTTIYDLGHRVVDPVNKRVLECVRGGGYNKSITAEPSWKLVGHINYPYNTEFQVWSKTYQLGDMVIGYIDSGVAGPIDHEVLGVFISKQAGNTSHDTEQVPPGPTVPPTQYTGNAWWSQVDVHYPKFNYYAVYSRGEKVTASDGSIYECLADGTGQQSLTEAVKWWIDAGPSNRAATFDGQITSASVGVDEIRITVAPGLIDTIGIIGITAATVQCTVRDGLGGTIVYDETRGMTGNIIADWWDFIYSDMSFPRRKTVFEGIPPYTSTHVTLTFKNESEVRIGTAVIGQSKNLGLGAQYGAAISIVDLSKTERDEFGELRFMQGNYYERLDITVPIQALEFNRIHLELIDLRGTPWFLIAADDPNLSEALLLYGFYKSYRNLIEYPSHTLINLEFESLAIT